MSEKRLKDHIYSGQGVVLICAGSGSDIKHIQKLEQALQEYNVPYEIKICSAHKQPIELMNMIKEYNHLAVACSPVGGSLVYIAVAGGTDALSGILSFHALAPVISCPPDAPNATCLSNPNGSSNATIIKPSNAARFVAQMFSHHNEQCRAKLLELTDNKLKNLEDDDRKWGTL